MTDGPRPTRAAWWALVALTGVNLLNYVDRYVLSGVLPLIEKPFSEGGLNVDPGKAGLIASAFIVAYTLISPAFGLLADRRQRLRLLAFGVALWSIVTALCGLAAGFVSLLVLRASTGVGEAAYAAVAPAVLSDHFHRGLRGRIMAIFNAAIPVGAAIGFVVGGVVGTHFGWRMAFFVAGGPGLLLAVLFLMMQDPPRGAMDPDMAHGRAPKPREALRLVGRRSYFLPCLGYALQTAGFGSIGIWLPTYLVNSKGMHLAGSTTMFGLITVVTGLLGTLAGGALSDWWFKRNPQAHLWTCGITTLMAAPVTALVIGATSPAYIWTVVGVGCFLVVMSIGPINSHIVNVLAPAERATGTSLSIFILHFLGDVPAIPVVGKVASVYGWQVGFCLIPIFMTAGGLIWCLAAFDARRRNEHRPVA